MLLQVVPLPRGKCAFINLLSAKVYSERAKSGDVFSRNHSLQQGLEAEVEFDFSQTNLRCTKH